VRENALDELRLLDARDHFRPPAAAPRPAGVIAARSATFAANEGQGYIDRNIRFYVSE
jgi:hypothetical protein